LGSWFPLPLGLSIDWGRGFFFREHVSDLPCLSLVFFLSGQTRGPAKRVQPVTPTSSFFLLQKPCPQLPFAKPMREGIRFFFQSTPSLFDNVLLIFLLPAVFLRLNFPFFLWQSLVPRSWRDLEGG